jgi:hypothetical protein
MDGFGRGVVSSPNDNQRISQVRNVPGFGTREVSEVRVSAPRAVLP